MAPAKKKPKRRKPAPRAKKTQFDRVVETVFKGLHGDAIKPEEPESNSPL